MIRLHSLFCAIFFLFSVSLSNTSQAQDRLTLSLPESVLAEAITASLPLEYKTASKSLKGNIRIIDISEIQLLDKHLACRLHLAGDKLQIITEMGGHNISLNVGSVELEFRTKAALRFDEKEQTLFITPAIEEVTSSQDAGGGDIGNTIVQLLNGNEFPINMQDIDPIITKAGAKTLTVTTRIADIRAKQDWLQVFLNPTISANE